jgi:hypothetical protein
MAKKISLFLAAVAVIAFAIPAMASASTGLTKEGVLLPVEKAIRGTNVGAPIITSSKFGELKCATVVLNGKITKNSESEGAEGVGSGESTATSCTLPGGGSFKVKEISLTSVKSLKSEVEEGHVSASFTAFELPQTCVFTLNNAKFTFETNTDEVKLEKQPLTVTGTNCGTATFDGKFTLETAEAKAIPLLIM